MIKRRPKSLAGTYEVNFSELSLKPIKIPNSNPNELEIIEIWFEEGICNIFFEDFDQELVTVKYNEKDNLYHLNYGAIHHVFEVKASLSGLCRYVDINILIDFNEL